MEVVFPKKLAYVNSKFTKNSFKLLTKTFDSAEE